MKFVNSFRKNKKYLLAYNLFMGILAIIAVAIVTIDLFTNPSTFTSTLFNYIDLSIILIFAIDYFTRLFFAKGKLIFIKSNIIDLISIIPFNTMFQAFRLIRLIKLLKFTRLMKLTKLVRIAALFGKFKNNVDKFIKTNNFQYALFITSFTLLLGSISFSISENKSFADSLWWSFVTITTVGYGDISPSTNIGRITASVLMLVGIGFLGMLTGTITTFFLKKEEEPSTIKNDVLLKIQERLNNFNELSKEDIDDIYEILKSLKKEQD